MVEEPEDEDPDLEECEEPCSLDLDLVEEPEDEALDLEECEACDDFGLVDELEARRHRLCQRKCEIMLSLPVAIEETVPVEVHTIGSSFLTGNSKGPL